MLLVSQTFKYHIGVPTSTISASLRQFRTHKRLALNISYFSGGHFEFWPIRPSLQWKSGGDKFPSERARKMLLDRAHFGGSWGMHGVIFTSPTSPFEVIHLNKCSKLLHV